MVRRGVPRLPLRPFRECVLAEVELAGCIYLVPVEDIASSVDEFKEWRGGGKYPSYLPEKLYGEAKDPDDVSGGNSGQIAHIPKTLSHAPFVNDQPHLEVRGAYRGGNAQLSFSAAEGANTVLDGFPYRAEDFRGETSEEVVLSLFKGDC